MPKKSKELKREERREKKKREEREEADRSSGKTEAERIQEAVDSYGRAYEQSKSRPG